ncbi:helix-turn-helix domain-containing protein [Akkermansia muciniphila]|uniref:helix-turn-helix domain-containing protein n=2 Tax=Akkermansia muciniphila TaxID=239935 RepID=UPI00122EB003|nr:helix-turn-helix transcriptional regulator [Akkermansia muciniphila]KAA3385625.1 helix-turn-helix transcriptional regulator [Akkermansia muciniphila]
MTDYSIIIGNRIKYLCKRRRISVRQLSIMAGGNYSTITDILNGKTQNPGIRTIHKIANAFDMTVADFLDFKELNEITIEDDR